MKGPAGPIGPAGPSDATSLQGATWQAPLSIGSITPAGGAFTSLTASLLNATAALTTSLVTSLNAALLLGKTWSSPDPIGSITPNTVASTTLTSTSLATLQSAKVSNLTASQYVTTDGSMNLTSATYPGNRQRTFWHDEATVTIGNVIFVGVSATNYYNLVIFQSPSVINDSFFQSFTLAAGTYTLFAMGTSFTGRGIVQWRIDGVLQGSQDWYSAAATPKVLSTPITVVGDGVHTVSGTVASKNGASIGFDMVLQKYWIK